MHENEIAWLLRDSSKPKESAIRDLGRMAARGFDSIGEEVRRTSEQQRRDAAEHHRSSLAQAHAWADEQRELDLQQITATEDMARRVASSLDDLSTAMSLAHQERMWAEQQQLDVLVGIGDVLRNPRAIEAEELYRMGRQCIASDMPNEALRMFGEAVAKNPLDYRVYLATGMIHLSLGRADDAARQFSLALKNARAPALEAMALYLRARAESARQRHGDVLDNLRRAQSLEAAAQAPGASQDDARGRSHYELARTIGLWFADQQEAARSAARTHSTEALASAEQAISFDSRYFAIASVDPALANLPGSRELLKRLHDSLRARVDALRRGLTEAAHVLAGSESQACHDARSKVAAHAGELGAALQRDSHVELREALEQTPRGFREITSECRRALVASTTERRKRDDLAVDRIREEGARALAAIGDDHRKETIELHDRGRQTQHSIDSTRYARTSTAAAATAPRRVPGAVYGVIGSVGLAVTMILGGSGGKDRQETAGKYASACLITTIALMVLLWFVVYRANQRRRRKLVDFVAQELIVSSAHHDTQARAHAAAQVACDARAAERAAAVERENAQRAAELEEQRRRSDDAAAKDAEILTAMSAKFVAAIE